MEKPPPNKLRAQLLPQHGFGRDDVDGMLTSPGAMGRRREDWRYGPRPLELPRDHPLPPPLPPPDFSRPPPPWLLPRPPPGCPPPPPPRGWRGLAGSWRDLVRWPPRRAGPGREKPRDGDPEPRRYLPWRRDGDGRRDGDEGCDDGWDEEEWRGGGAVERDDRLAHADDDGDVWLPGEDEIIVPEEHEGFQMSEEWLALFAATERRREAKVRERRREARRRERPKVPAAEVAEAKVAAIIAARRAAEANDGDGGGGADASVDERGGAREPGGVDGTGTYGAAGAARVAALEAELNAAFDAIVDARKPRHWPAIALNPAAR